MSPGSRRMMVIVPTSKVCLSFFLSLFHSDNADIRVSSLWGPATRDSGRDSDWLSNLDAVS